jgi:pimeloyl-ACP methyl ester carboxylesterase
MPNIMPEYATVDGLRIRYADSSSAGPDAVLTAPWPESIYAFDQVWDELAAHARLIAVDFPGFGGSETNEELLSPRAMGGFILRAIEVLGLNKPHIVGPDIGTSAALFAAAQKPDAFRSVVVGSGGASVPVDVTGILKSWVFEPNPDKYRSADPAQIVDPSLSTITGFTAPEHIRDDYLASNKDGRFAVSLKYAQQYPDQLPQLAELLPGITVPVRVVQGEHDGVVPADDARFLVDRIPGSKVDFIKDAGHFCWEEKPRDYARLEADRWDSH